MARRAMRPRSRRSWRGWTVLLAVALAAPLLVLPAPDAGAASITAVGSDDEGARRLGLAMVTEAERLLGASFVTAPPSGFPHGVVDVAGAFPIHGSDFSVLTTGTVDAVDDDDTSGWTGTPLGGGNVRGDTDYDVTVLRLRLLAPNGTRCLRFNAAFLSEEFPEFVGGGFNDAFIAELNTTSWATDGTSISAPDNFATLEGTPVSVDVGGAASLTRAQASGTTYDGGTPLLEVSTPVGGGEHTLYLSLFDQVDQAYDSAVFLDNLRFDERSACPSGARVVGRPPLVLVPGFGGSRLEDADGAELWPRAETAYGQPVDEFLANLSLEADGTTPHGSAATPRGVVRSVAPDPAFGVADLYTSTLARLEQAGYRSGVDLFVFPYDWRKSSAAAAGDLLALLERVRSSAGSSRVDLLAHSQGGLVVLEALRRQESLRKVRRAVAVGTPMLGAPYTLGVLELASPCLTLRWEGCFLDPRRVQRLVTNFPGLYEMLPSPDHHLAVGTPLEMDRDADGDGNAEGSLSYEGWSARVAAARNATLLQSAAAFHAALDRSAPADPDVRLLRIAGDALATPTRFREYDREVCFRWFFRCELGVGTEVLHGSGDGVAPVASAGLYDPGRGFDRRAGFPSSYLHGADHAALIREKPVLDAALEFFGVPVATSSAGSLDDGPAPLDGWEVEVVGSVTSVVTDSATGGRLGEARELAAGVSAEQIAGGTYASVGATRSYFLTRPGTYSLSLEAKAARHIRVRVRRHRVGSVGEVAAFHVSAPLAGTRAALTLDTNAPLADLRLAVDDDGNGVPERVLVPDTTGLGADSAPPRSAANAVQVDAATARVELRASDGTTGAGVSRILYVLEDETDHLLGSEPEPEIYAGPFNAPLHKHVLFRAVDLAGNVELIRVVRVEEVLTDDVPNHRLFAHAMEVNDHLRRFIAPINDQDWFSFKADGTSTYRLQLFGLRDDYDLELYDGDGTFLTAPRLRGRSSEEMRSVLGRGTYYVRVIGHLGAWSDSHHYQLRLQTMGK